MADVVSSSGRDAFLADVGPALSLAVRPFVLDGAPCATVIVKATLRFHPGEPGAGGPARLVAAERIALGEERWKKTPLSSVTVANDLALGKAACDVTLVGSATSEKHVPAIVTRLRVERDDQPLLDKRVVAVAPRDETGEPILMTSCPLVWEEAFGGRKADAERRAANPIGSVTPRLSKQGEPEGPGAYGPIAPEWGVRQALLGDAQKTIAAEVPSITRAFPWGYFQHAPGDQRVGFLRGDERVILEGVAPATLQFDLPKLCLRAWIVDEAGAAMSVSLVIDTLALDASRGIVHVVARGTAPRPRATDVVVARVASGVVPVCPPRDQLSRAPGAWAIPLALLKTAPDGSTLTLEGGPPDAANASAPFRIAVPDIPVAPALVARAPVAPLSLAVAPRPPPPLEEAPTEDEEEPPATPPPPWVVAARKLRAAGMPEARIREVIGRYRASLREK